MQLARICPVRAFLTHHKKTYLNSYRQQAHLVCLPLLAGLSPLSPHRPLPNCRPPQTPAPLHSPYPQKTVHSKPSILQVRLARTCPVRAFSAFPPAPPSISPHLALFIYCIYPPFKPLIHQIWQAPYLPPPCGASLPLTLPPPPALYSATARRPLPAR